MIKGSKAKAAQYPKMHVVRVTSRVCKELMLAEEEDAAR